MVTKEQALEKIKSLVERFNEQIEYYKKGEYKETQTRRDFIDPFWKALGWDVDNESGCAESYREVIHEDRVKVGGATKAPDYSFRLAGGKRLFFLEAKKPSVVIKDETAPAYQVRRYGWSAKMPISVITDFEEFAIYDCSTKPKETDKASNGRIKYLTYLDYLKEFDFIWHTFSKEYVLKGSFDKYITSDKNKKGTTTVDAEFLQSLDKWRVELAVNIALRNKNINEDELNFIVQHTIDRIIFLRIAEDRSAERYGDLQDCIKSGDFYQNLLQCFHIADQKYNSGLFDFRKDKISDKITIDNKVVKNIISELYYPICPYEFSVLSVEILGSAYEQFLGKQITLSKSGKATIEEKPEVRKAGGVYYTPQYIVEYIVKNTIGKLVENKTPKEISQLKICDPACGSGSFLIGAYQFLLNWHKDFYNKLKPENGKLTIKGSKNDVLTPTGELTTAEKKRILLNNIYGVDLDNNAVEVTKLSLLLKCMEGETKETIEAQTKLFHDRILPTLDNNIKSGNSLIDLDYYDGQFEFEERKIKPFSWQKAFPEVFNRNVEIDKRLPFKKQYDKIKQLEDDTQDFIAQFVVEEPITEFNKKQNGGFDCIIGNPPYVKVADKNIFDYFNKKFVHQDYQQDLYLLFLEQYKNLLVIGGKLGVIIPNTWLQSIKFRNIRKYLLNDFYWERILHIKEHIFKAVVDTHVLVFERNNYIKNYDVVIDVFEKKEITPLHIIDQNKLPDNGDIINILANEKEKKIFEKIKSKSTFIKEECFSNVGVKPFQVGKGKPKQTREIVNTKPFVVEDAPKPKGKNWLPLMRGSLMNRYTNFWNNNSWIEYGEWLAEPRSPEVFEAEEKIIVRQTGDRIIATLIGANIICRNNLHVIISNEINHKFILGILNSKLTDFYYFQINPERGEVLAEVKKQHVEQLPIPKNVSDKQQTEIIKFVEQLLKLNADKQNTTLPNQLEMINNRIEHTESKINQIIYELYNLTKEEIKLIETR